MTAVVTVRQATSDDVPAIVELRRERAAWLSSRGSDQWSDAGLDEATFTQRVSASVEGARVWVAVAEGEVIGTIAIDHHANPGLWTDTELNTSVMAHRMIVRTDMAGLGVGEILLQKADDVAKAEGRAWVRLDAWTNNEKLHRLYEGYGFRHVRTVPDYHTSSAALFERRVNEPGWELFSSMLEQCDLGNMNVLAYGCAGNPPA